MKINFLIIIFYLLSSTYNLRNFEVIENFDSLLEIIPSVFSKFTTIFFRSLCLYSNQLTYNYFKKIEASIEIKNYLDIKDSDFPEVIDNMVKSLNITDIHYKNIYRYIQRFISSFYVDDYEDMDWLNQIIVSIVPGQKDKVSYGMLFARKKGNKIDIIFCYGFETLNSIQFENQYLYYSEYNYIDNDYIGESHTSYINSVDLGERGDKTFMIFLRLAGLKAFGNKYGIDIPYPRFIGFN